MHGGSAAVYQFSELTEEAKARAREWYRNRALYLDWTEYLLSDDTIEQMISTNGYTFNIDVTVI